MSHQIEIEDAHGRRRTEGLGYKVKDDERVMSVRVPYMMMDGRPSGAMMADSATQHQLGDAVTTDSIDGTPRIRFSDGTSALLHPSGQATYCDAAGNLARSLTADQRAHMARSTGGPYELGAFIARDAVGEARRDDAFEKMNDRLTNGWRGADAKVPTPVTDTATAHASMVDRISNAWRSA